MGRKRIILSFSFISLIILAIILSGVWYLASASGPLWGTWFIGALFSLVTITLLLFAAAIMALTWALLRQKNTPLQGLAARGISFILPLSLRLARLFKIDEDDVRRSFVQVHNELTRKSKQKLTPSEVLLLGPVCLQKGDCQYRISGDINNCRQCGRCPVDQIVRLQSKYGFQAAICTGGTRARQLIKEIRPKVVVAIACERDLTSGIQDSRPMKVIGITNQRPHGPCFETQFDVEELEGVIKELLNPQEALVTHQVHSTRLKGG